MRFPAGFGLIQVILFVIAVLAPGHAQAGAGRHEDMRDKILTGRVVSVGELTIWIGDIEGAPVPLYGIEPLYAPGTVVYAFDETPGDCPMSGDQVWSLSTYEYLASETPDDEIFGIRHCEPLADQTLYAYPLPLPVPPADAAAETARLETSLQALALTFDKKTTTVAEVEAALGVDGFTREDCPGACTRYRMSGGDKAPFVAEFTLNWGDANEFWHTSDLKVTLTGDPGLCLSQPGWAVALLKEGTSDDDRNEFEARTWMPQVRVDGGNRVLRTDLLLTTWVWSGYPAATVTLSPIDKERDADRLMTAEEARNLMDRSACARSVSFHD